MTTIDYNDLPAIEKPSFRPFAWMGTAFRTWRERAWRRRAMHDLSHLDARLLRDIGIDWEDVHDGILGHRRRVWLNPLPRERK